jgi:tetratricopeptide (TPR) repeat protein
MAYPARLVAVGLIAILGVPAALAQPAGEDAPPPAAPAAPTPAPAPPPAVPAVTAPPKVVLTPEAEAQLSAADKTRADALRREATTLFSNGRYKEAIEKFRQAFEINQDIDLLYSIAVSYQNLEAWQECVNFMERYLEKAPVGPKRDRADNTRISCDARIERDQQLIIESDPPGARVFLDDKARGTVGTTPFRNYVRPGKHKVWVELDGYQPVMQDIEIQKAEPFRMNLVLRREQNAGWLFVDSTVIQARVYIDGKNVGLTPFKQPLAYGAGLHQVVVERDGYTRYNQQVMVNKGQVKVVDAYIVRAENFTSWRTPVGWTLNVVGALAIGGGITAWQFADKEFNDTDEFDQLALYEKLGYGIGGGLLAIGTTLVIWDQFRDVVLDEHKNPDYKKPVSKPRDGEAPVGIGVGPSGVTFGFTF